MSGPAKVEFQRVVKKDYLIWPEMRLSREDQAALEAKIRSVLGEDTEVKRTSVLELEGIRYWVAAITPEQGEKINSLPKILTIEEEVFYTMEDTRQPAVPRMNE